MVKLPKESKEASSQVCIELLRLENSHLCLQQEPARLLELEELAELATHYMRTCRTTPNVPNVKQYLMDRLRQIFNLEFKMRCDRCGTAHYQDEVTAPER